MNFACRQQGFSNRNVSRDESVDNGSESAETGWIYRSSGSTAQSYHNSMAFIVQNPFYYHRLQWNWIINRRSRLFHYYWNLALPMVFSLNRNVTSVLCLRYLLYIFFPLYSPKKPVVATMAVVVMVVVLAMTMTMMLLCCRRCHPKYQLCTTVR